MKTDFKNLIILLSKHYNIAFEGSVAGNCTFTIVGETKTKIIRIRLDQWDTQVSIEVIDEGKYGYCSIQKVERIRDFDDQTILNYIIENLSIEYRLLM